MGFFCSLLFLSLSQYLHSVALFSSDYLVNCIEYMTNKMANILDNLDLRVIYQLNFISHEISKWHNVVASCVLLTELPCKYKILCSMLLCRHQQMLSKVFFFYFLFVCVCVCVFFLGLGGRRIHVLLQYELVLTTLLVIFGNPIYFYHTGHQFGTFIPLKRIALNTGLFRSSFCI